MEGHKINTAPEFVLTDNLKAQRGLIMSEVPERRRFRKGQQLSRGGTPSPQVYFILEGAARASVVNVYGYERTLGYLRQNTICCMDALRHDAGVSVTITALTTLRAVGDLFGSDIALKRKTDAGKGAAAGLRMFVSGMAITAPGGHGAGTFARTAETPEEFEKLVEKNVTEGADFIKICITGGVMDAKKRGEPGEVKMTQAQVSAVCSRAHALGKKVAAHVQSKAGAELAAIGGVDTIEHGAPLTEESVRLLRERKGAQVVTCSPALPCARLPHEVTKLGEAASYNSEVVMQGMIDGAAQAAAAGIAVGIGTDASCPFCTQYNMWREVLWFEKCMNISAAEALYTATLGNARILGVGDETGSIREGKSADILLLEGNPIADLTALRDIDCMFAQGRFISHPKPKRLPAIEAQLDRLTEEL